MWTLRVVYSGDGRKRVDGLPQQIGCGKDQYAVWFGYAPQFLNKLLRM
jgi:hypothetical protein